MTIVTVVSGCGEAYLLRSPVRNHLVAAGLQSHRVDVPRRTTSRSRPPSAPGSQCGCESIAVIWA